MKLALLPLLVVLGACATMPTNSASLAERMGRISGHVTERVAKEEAHDGQGYLLLQRIDRPRYVIGLQLNIHGQYEAMLPAGRYRVVLPEGARLREGHSGEVVVAAPWWNRVALDVEFVYAKYMSTGR